MINLTQYFKPNKDKNEVNELNVKKGVFKTLYKGVRIPWLSLAVGAFFAVFNSLVILTQYDNYMAIFTGAMTDLTPLWMYLGASFVQYLLIFCSVISDLGLVKIVTGVRKKMWKKMMRLPLKEFETEEPNGMLSRITSDAEYAAKPFYAIIVILQLFIYIVSISAAAPKNLPQALVILIITLTLAVVEIVVSVKICAKAVTLVQNSISLQTNHYSEQLANIKFVKASNAEEKAIARSNELIDNRYRASIYNAFATALQTLANSFSYIIIYSCAFLGGIIAIKSGAITDLAPVYAVYVFGMALEMTLVALMTLPSYFSTAFGGSRKLVSIFGLKEEEADKGETIKAQPSDVELKNVSFGYGDKNVINDVSVTIPCGKTTAIVGPNGSGKSTLIKLIDRLYPPTDGEISVNDCEASLVSLKSWKEQFGIVSQNASLFSGSIRDNICYGIDREVSEDEINKVVELANLTDVVNAHKEGLAYDIGIKGSKLSGGEQQRVAIARALLKNPNYLILDEATANLDGKTEAEVVKGLTALMKDRTVIMIAHNHSAIEGAASVIVLDKGAVVDQGTSEQLSERCGFYKSLLKQS